MKKEEFKRIRKKIGTFKIDVNNDIIEKPIWLYTDTNMLENNDLNININFTKAEEYICRAIADKIRNKFSKNSSIYSWSNGYRRIEYENDYCKVNYLKLEIFSDMDRLSNVLKVFEKPLRITSTCNNNIDQNKIDKFMLKAVAHLI